MKRKIFAIILTVLLTIPLAACSRAAVVDIPLIPVPEAAFPAAAPADVPGARTLIRFAAQEDSTPATAAMLAAFNASQTQYTAEYVKLPNQTDTLRETLLASLKSGSTEYDVLSLDVVWAGEFAAEGYIEPIDAYMGQAGLEAGQFNAGAMAAGNYNTQQYALPFFQDVGVLFFRKDIVSPNNAVKLMSGNYSWEELLTMAEMYKGREGTSDGFVFQAAQYEGLICNAGEFTNNWNTVRGGLRTMKNFVDSDATPANILAYTERETAESFAGGNSVFARNWPYQWGAMLAEGLLEPEQVEVAPLPDGGTVGGWLVAMNRKSEHKDGAWALMEYIATSGQKDLSIQGGYLPGYVETLTDPEVMRQNELLMKPGFQEALTTSISRPVAIRYTQLSGGLQTTIYQYLHGDIPLGETTDAVEAALATAG